MKRRGLWVVVALAVAGVLAAGVGLVVFVGARVSRSVKLLRPLPPPPSQEYARAVAVCEEYIEAWKKDDYAEEFRLTSVWSPCRYGPADRQFEVYQDARSRRKASPEVRRLTWLVPTASTRVTERPDLLDRPELYWKTMLFVMAGGTEQQFEEQWKVWRQGSVAPVVVSFPDGELIMILIQEGGEWRLMTTPEDALDKDLIPQGIQTEAPDPVITGREEANDR